MHSFNAAFWKQSIYPNIVDSLINKKDEDYIFLIVDFFYHVLGAMRRT